MHGRTRDAPKAYEAVLYISTFLRSHWHLATGMQLVLPAAMSITHIGPSFV